MKKVLFLYSHSSLQIEGSFYKSFGKIDLEKYQKYSNSRKKSLLIGRKLLEVGLMKLGINIPIKQLKFTNRMKPFFINSNVQFNISHSKDMVCCALSTDKIMIGVDMEYKQSKTIIRTSSFFNKKEEYLIKYNENLMLDYWTKKEAILKACNSHIFDMNKIDCTMDRPLYNGEQWIDSKLDCHTDYIIRLMTNKPIDVTIMCIT